LPGERSEIGSALGSVEGSAERIPQTLEQVGCLAQLLRTVLAKKSEKTGSTAGESHSGQAGCGRIACSAIVSVRENSA